MISLWPRIGYFGPLLYNNDAKIYQIKSKTKSELSFVTIYDIM